MAMVIRNHIDGIQRWIYRPHALFLKPKFYRVKGTHDIVYPDLTKGKSVEEGDINDDVSSRSDDNDGSEERPNRIMFLPNHRGWGDFVIEPLVLGTCCSV